MTSVVLPGTSGAASSGAGETTGLPVAPSHGELHPLPLEAVRLREGPWAHLQQVNANTSLRHVLSWMEKVGWLENFDRVAEGRTRGPRPGLSFSDSEAYKLLEALAWESHRTGDAWTERAFVDLSARVARAQDDDGYLNTAFGHDGQEPRWSDLPMGHELYCLGHLLQAAVARFRTVGDDPLVQMARRAADQACAEFGPDGRDGVCGHPEVEVALAELGRALREPRYLDQARLFLERRGHGTLGEQPHGRSYFQDDVPVREATALRGHAVRALYLTAAAVDVAVEDHDDALLKVLGAQWDRTVERRTYLTGGMGSRHQDEGFGEDFELPNDRAYCESCAGIASVMVSWRLLLATGDERHADLIERTLYNVVATSPSTDGDAFFYANTLHQRTEGELVATDRPSARAESSSRAPWFDVSCCPTNLARTFASLSCYVATTSGRGVQLHQYVDATVTAAPAEVGDVELRVSTAYPDSGAIRVEVVRAPGSSWALRLRVPSWAAGATAQVGDEPPRIVEPGAHDLERAWQVGDVVRLLLPVEPRLTFPDPRIDAARGCVAVERGPDVLCLEGRALPHGWELDDVVLTGLADDGPAGPDAHAVVGRRRRGPAVPWPYAAHTTSDALDEATAVVPLTRYRTWGETGPTSMRVWLPAGPDRP